MGLVVLLAVASGLVAAAPSPGSLQGKLGFAQRKEGSLRSRIASDSGRVARFDATIADFNQRLAGIQQSLNIERGLLDRMQADLRNARGRLLGLKLALVRDRRLLSQQLVASYEAPQHSMVNVIMDAHGFADLLETADRLKRIQRQNIETIGRVRSARVAVTVQAKRLAVAEARQSRVTRAILIQHDQVAQLRIAVVDKRVAVARARSHKTAELSALVARRQALESRLAKAQALIAGAAPSIGLPAGASVILSGGAFSPHGGTWGFFPAAGTNYAVGNEPIIAARLDQLGTALQLHLIGLSGYRSPQHSVEVGGFANDPHTQGAASDTPGVEGVPEATLNRFGLTRPFPGPAEADHIQLA